MKRKLILATISVIPLIVIGFLTNTLLGIFLLVVVLYIFSPYLFGVQPAFDPIVRFIESNNEASLAVVGLLIAYFAALITWRRQKLIEIRLAAGSEIRGFFEQAQQCGIDLSSFAENLVEAKEAADMGRLEDELWRIRVIRDQFPEALEARNKIRTLGRSAHGLHQKYRLLTNSSFIAQYAMPKAVESVSDLSVLALFYIPPLTESDAEILRIFSRVDCTSWYRYLEKYFQISQRMSMNAEAVNAAFQKEILIPNLAQAWSQIRMVRTLRAIPEDDLRPR